MEHMRKITLIASQAETINNYKNRKMKLLLCCANIYFNKQCLIQNLTPTYAKIKVANTSPAAIFTQRKTQILRIKDEIRFLYKKKLQLNKQLYHSHLTAEVTHNNINKHMDLKYHSVHKNYTISNKRKKSIQPPIKDLNRTFIQELST